MNIKPSVAGNIKLGDISNELPRLFLGNIREKYLKLCTNIFI